MRETREIFEPIDTERIRKTVELALSQKEEVRSMKKVLGVFDIDEGLVSALRRAIKNETGITQVALYKSTGLDKWELVQKFDKPEVWDLDAEMLAHALTIRALCRLSPSYEMATYFRVMISGGMHKAHALTIILEEEQFRQVRQGMKQVDPDEYSNICFDLLVANRIIHMQEEGEAVSEIFGTDYGTRQKISALDRLQRLSKLTYQDFVAEPGSAKGAYQVAESGTVVYLSQRPPSAETGDEYIDIATADYWVWNGRGWMAVGGNSGSEPEAPTTIKIRNSSDEDLDLAATLGPGGEAKAVAKQLTPIDMAAYESAVKSVKEQKVRTNPVHEKDGKWYFWDETWSDRIGPYDSEQEANKKIRDYAHFLETGDARGEDNGLTERIDVIGGPLPTLPKVEICPECKNTGQVLNFMQYHPCPRGCKAP